MTIKKLFTERKTVFCLLLSFLSAFSVTYCFFDFNSYSFFSLVFTPFIFAFIRRVDISQINITSKILNFVLSALLSVSFYLTNDMAGKMDAVFSSVITTFLFAASIAGLTHLLFYVLIYICNRFIASDFKAFDAQPKKSTFFILWAIIFASYFFVFLLYFPGVMTPDSFTQMYIVSGNLPLSNNHPLVHTLLMLLTTKVTGYSPWLYVIVQILAVSAIFAYLCYYMRKKNVWKWLWYITVAFLAFHPVHTYNSVTVTKDTLFSAFVLLYSVFVYEICSSKGTWLKKNANKIHFCFTALLMCLFRSNGILIALLSTVLILFILKKNSKSFAVCSCVSIVFYFGIVYGIYPLFDVEATSVTEALAIPLQQLCCVVADGKTLSPEIESYLNEILPLDIIAAEYDPVSVDAIKFHEQFNGEIISSDLFKFIKAWFEVLLQHPITYIKAYLSEVEALWNMSMEVGMLEPSHTSPNFVQANMTPLIPVLHDVYDSVVNISYLSTYAFFAKPFWNPALYYALACICGVCCFIKKKYSNLASLIPVFALFVSVAVSMPRATAGRYVYAIFCCIPLIIFAAVEQNKKDNINN